MSGIEEMRYVAEKPSPTTTYEHYGSARSVVLAGHVEPMLRVFTDSAEEDQPESLTPLDLTAASLRMAFCI
jgi:hypothetical protein